MGSPSEEPNRDNDESPQTTLPMAAFRIDVTPVTVRAFEARQDELPTQPGDAKSWWNNEDTPSEWHGACNLGSARKDHPANCVTWHAANAYCALHGGALPTEAQAEYAIRAGTLTVYPWGEAFDPSRAISSVACEARGCAGGTAAVEANGPRCNVWGVCDLVGNVWEWTSTDYQPTLGAYTNQPADGVPAKPVHRGGGWHNHKPFLFRAAHRGLNYPKHGLTGVGFRCAYPTPS